MGLLFLDTDQSVARTSELQIYSSILDQINICDVKKVQLVDITLFESFTNLII